MFYSSWALAFELSVIHWMNSNICVRCDLCLAKARQERREDHEFWTLGARGAAAAELTDFVR